MTKRFTAAGSRCEGHRHVVLITTGSVASIKAPLIVEELLKVQYPRSKPFAIACSSFVHLSPSPSLPLPGPISFHHHPALRCAWCSIHCGAPFVAQGRIGAGGRDQTVPDVFPAGGHTQAGVDVWTDDDEWDVRLTTTTTTTTITPHST